MNHRDSGGVRHCTVGDWAGAGLLVGWTLSVLGGTGMISSGMLSGSKLSRHRRLLLELARMRDFPSVGSVRRDVPHRSDVRARDTVHDSRGADESGSFFSMSSTLRFNCGRSFSTTRQTASVSIPK